MAVMLSGRIRTPLFIESGFLGCRIRIYNSGSSKDLDKESFQKILISSRKADWI